MSGADDKKKRAEGTPPETHLYSTPGADPNQTLDTSVPLAGGAETLGQLKDRFELLSELGQGGMGVVYKARDRETGGLIALKMLKPEIASDATLLARFKDELLLARKITHKNVCRTHELHRIGQTAAIAMEYIEGESLRQLLRRVEGLSIRHTLKLARQLLSGLAEAHAQGVTHRDLKPENLMVDREGNLKIMDFGIARSVESKEKTTEGVTGTPAYMSPEQAEGKSVDHRTDIYAVGLVLYEMFTGEATFSGDTALSVAHKQIHEPPPTPTDIEPYLPGHIERAILKCLEKNPKKRYQSVEQLEAALIKKSEEAQAPAVELPSHLTSHRKSDFALLALGLVGLVVFVLGVPWTAPESNLRIKFTRQMLVEKAREELTKRDWNLVNTASSSTRKQLQLIPYRFLGEKEGYETAHQALTGDYPPILLSAKFRAQSGSTETTATVSYTLTGEIRSLDLPVIDLVAEDVAAGRESAQAIALEDIATTFGVSGDELTLERESPLREDKRNGYAFQWMQEAGHGMQWEYQVNVYDRVTKLQRTPRAPKDWDPPPTGIHFTVGGVILFLVWSFSVFLFFSRKLFRGIRLRSVTVLALPVVLGVGGISVGFASQMIFEQGPGFGLFMFIFFFLFLGIFFATSVFPLPWVVSYLARHRLPHLTANFEALMRYKLPAQSGGLAVLRGAAFGGMAAGIFSGVQWSGIAAGMSWPRLGEFQALGPLLQTDGPSVVFLGAASLDSLHAGLMLALLLALAARWIHSKPLLLLIGGSIILGLSGLPRPLDAFILIASFLLGFVFTWVLLTYDLLTLLTTFFTFKIITGGAPLSKLYAEIGNGQFWVLFILLGILLTWALYTGFRPVWSRFGRRFGEMVD